MAQPAPKKTNAGDRRFITIVGVLLAVGVALISYVVAKGKPVATVVAEIRDTTAAAAAAPAGATSSTGPGSVKRGGYSLGSDTALVEIVEHGDFECPACGAFAREYEPEIREKLVKSGVVRFRYVDYPWPFHPNALSAHNAAACAAEQGKFWEMHDKIYEGQPAWSAVAHGRESADPSVAFKRYARQIGADSAAFATCLSTRPYEPVILANKAAAEARGVHSTPTFFIGKRMLAAVANYAMLKPYVDSALVEARQSRAGK